MSNGEIAITSNSDVEPIVISSELESNNVGISISSWSKDKIITEEILKEVQYSSYEEY